MVRFLPLDVAGRDRDTSRVALNHSNVHTDALGRRVSVLALGRSPVELDQLRVVDVHSERALDSDQVRPVSIRRELDPMLEPSARSVMNR